VDRVERSVTPGVYFLRMEAVSLSSEQKRVSHRKMLLMD
jgi:hypothetical protein